MNSGKTIFALEADGTTESGSIDKVGPVLALQSKTNAVPGAPVSGLYDNSGTFRLGILNGTGMVVDSATSSAPIGAYVAKYAVHDAAGVLLGYFPIYA